MSEKGKLSEVASVFFKMGCFAFGGPPAHIAMMEEEVVNKRKWMDRQHFLDLMGATNLIPGPNSTEMTMHCGHERAGVLGLFVAGFCFIFPAVLITGIFAWLYVSYGHLPSVEPFIYGIKPAVLALIASATLKLGKKGVKNKELAVLGIIAVIVCLLGINEIAVLLSTGFVGILYFQIKNKSQDNVTKSFLPLFFLQGSAVAAATIKVSTMSVFLSFLKVGAVLYGSGYVLFAYLDAELVMKGWLTRQQLMDAVAVGQFTPGPVLSTATFVGFQLNGFWGAVASTIGIFLPSFLFVWLLNPLVKKMRNSKVLRSFLDSVNVAAVAVMVSVLFEMSRSTLMDWRSIVIAIAGFYVVFKMKKVSSMWVVIGGSLLGFLLGLV